MKYYQRTMVKAVLVAAMGLMAAFPVRAPADDQQEQRLHVGSLLKTSHEHLAAGHNDSVFVDLKEILEIDPNNQDAFYMMAVAHLALADSAQAIVVLTDGIARNPLSSRLKLLRVRLHLMSGELAEAENLLNSVLQFKPNHPETLYLSGLLSLARGDTVHTLDAWDNALRRLDKGTRTESR